MSDKLSNQTIEGLLQNKYLVNFEVTDNRYSPELNCYVFTANPSDDKSLVINGQYEKDSISDDYIQVFYNHTSTVNAQRILSAYYNSFAVRCYLTFDYIHVQGNKLPELSSLMDSKSIPIEFWNMVYLFSDIESYPDTDLFEGIYKLMEAYSQYPEREIGFIIYIWDKSFLENKDFSALKFGFNEYGDEFADKFPVKAKYIKTAVKFKYRNTNYNKITKKEIVSHLSPFDIRSRMESVTLPGH